MDYVRVKFAEPTRNGYEVDVYLEYEMRKTSTRIFIDVLELRRLTVARPKEIG